MDGNRATAALGPFSRATMPAYMRIQSRLRRTALVPLLALLLGISACGGGNSDAPPTSSTSSTIGSTTSGVPTSTASARCDHPTFSVEYPARWSTNDESEGDPCRWFHPEPFEVPENSEAVGLAISLRYDDVDFEFVTDPKNNSDEVLDRRSTKVDGKTAVRMHTRSKGEGLLDAGVESVTWYVDMGAETFTGATHGVAEDGLETNAPILDSMMESLEFTG